MGAKLIAPSGGWVEKMCGRCEVVKPVAEFHRHRRRPDGLNWDCKACIKAHRKLHPQKVHPLTDAQRRAQVAATKRWERRHPERKRQCRRAWYHKLKAKVFDKLGRACVECGYSDERALQVDHVHGGGTMERESMSRDTYLQRVLAAPPGKYQVLCANCNWIKRVENDGEGSGKRRDPSRLRLVPKSSAA